MADYVVVIVLSLFIVANVARRILRSRTGARPVPEIWQKIGRYAACFASGGLFSNFVPHFFHGVSGEPFPAPFARFLGPGFPSAASNVVWGTLNLALAYYLFRKGRVVEGDVWSKALFLAGMIAVGVFLACVFSNTGA